MKENFVNYGCLPEAELLQEVCVYGDKKANKTLRYIPSSSSSSSVYLIPLHNEGPSDVQPLLSCAARVSLYSQLKFISF